MYCRVVAMAPIDDDDDSEAAEAARARPSFIGAQLEAQAKAAAAKGDWRRVATVALEAYGDEILGFLIAQAKDEVAAHEAFSMFTEAMWRGLMGFRWECTLRTWCYTLARHAWFRYLRDRARGAETVPLMSSGSIPIDELASRIKATQPSVNSGARMQLEMLREELEVDDQTLLTLRLDRSMAWRDVARVMSDPDDDMDDAALERRAGGLRKRFMKIKADLREQLEAARRER
jgi:RNA polymerase sigma-70 factor, ECF subfamily